MAFAVIYPPLCFSMASLVELSAIIRELYAVIGRLERECERWDRRFTLDDHLLGSIGEVMQPNAMG